LYRLHYRIKILIILYSTLVSCCTTRYYDHRVPHPFLESLVDNFIAICDSHGLKCSTHRERPPIAFVEMKDKTTLGMCQTIPIMGITHIMPLITISIGTLGYTEDEMKVVVYHELIHCYFFVDHHEGKSPHIMRSYSLYQHEIDEAGGVYKLLDNFFNEYKSINNL
jgi:hypothetical protein